MTTPSHYERHVIDQFIENMIKALKKSGVYMGPEVEWTPECVALWNSVVKRPETQAREHPE